MIEACRNVLNKYGISITQTVEYTPEVTKTPEGGGDIENEGPGEGNPVGPNGGM